MSHKQNQPPLGLGTSANKADLEQSIDISQKDIQEQAGCLFHNNYGRGLIVTAEELPVNVKSQTASQVFGSHGEDRLKALARLMMVSFTWSMAELSQRK
ncbi:MAG: hypothetical protein EAZ78_23320 [Oscillatoriales cyanobacterium]|uniref:Uncharacterized protein n=1 Tax=Microcoleus anatoxicus PTRS2 TaxID=2705321 RepID=A0ABU8YHP4_9CYAN|nr:MAG: hypothetical protein EA000_24950 [Oscillatoriales cyanobacterium]TAD93378.1 MAG: hypothetical protein EAZ98_23085 [Oscillatoriales cyanobacterium]TAE06213.1 MAG: hypothetical protein EAZ96_03160 [Oscillatoriales cyanobacterium]TAE98865.1 MAG: hypothetical protein EAZ78_23320 [Oscillatoriales cyanobacterium]TAF43936.1 MAG: hypothetical protein EAZ68_07110 [Oscillatoriales cyanobacterium]